MYIMIFTSSSKTLQKRHSETFVYPWFRTGSARERGGDSVVLESVRSHIVAFCRRDGFKSLSWQGLLQMGKFYHHYHLDCYRVMGVAFSACLAFSAPGKERKKAMYARLTKYP